MKSKARVESTFYYMLLSKRLSVNNVVFAFPTNAEKEDVSEENE